MVAEHEAEVLSDSECLRLLGAATVGRIVFTEHALPAVQPVAFTLAGRVIEVSNGVDGRLAKAVSGEVVAFEADHVAYGGVEWSVVALGRVDPLPAWREDAVRHRLRIRIELLSGWRERGNNPLLTTGLPDPAAGG
ncbi:nitroimidazol reductase NimA-like FMN-containing flavoprotein (pyridoxamine 5'-phosphate oxidase superfamily) [Crossiella equi]|uniref:Nitroimidazol reductase NimA-like FMN-containing flavoprotein (Pyridoxamine 5'-phosphate oxidase superfamily) n=1 Tax=Crossiella equi TaxID=130796 RepID=A0ABS5A5H4_9PSEU|nr:pyridoxamine 5'-phosphate oxidase family protein [Crossiella equi]MBP2471839.1 nitroimidazol reductase NimA-like FMN-containing flavoprotein (pyridoxamine 5'-phosphate oxidase superfamily) [Crossiella equi]